VWNPILAVIRGRQVRCVAVLPHFDRGGDFLIGELGRAIATSEPIPCLRKTRVWDRGHKHLHALIVCSDGGRQLLDESRGGITPAGEGCS
jgi:hypothetical protein